MNDKTIATAATDRFQSAVNCAIPLPLIDMGNQSRTYKIQSDIVKCLTTQTGTMTVRSDYEQQTLLVLGMLDWQNMPLQHAKIVRSYFSPEFLAKLDHVQDCACDHCDTSRRMKAAGVGGPAGNGMELTTEEVAAFFQSRCAGLGKGVREDLYGTSIAPAAYDSFAGEPIGGDLGEQIAEYPDLNWESNAYQAFDLSQTPVGGAVYRVSCTPSLWWFHHRAEGIWDCVLAPAVWPEARDAYGNHWPLGAMLLGVRAAFAAEIE